MALEEKIKPVNKDHSIKEAVISLFLASPIIKPERFNELIEKDFQKKFQHFETLQQVQVQVKGQPGSTPNLSQQIIANAGFKFTAFEKGQAVRVLQGLNDSGNGRIFIAYHALDYSRWIPFLNDYLEAVEIISNFNDLFVTAVSLQYVDEFLLLTNEKIEQDLIFNTNAKFIPAEFFNSTINQYSILTEKDVEGGIKHLDRLEIRYERLLRPSITIIHNISKVLPEVTSLKDFLAQSQFKEMITKAHLENKEVLRDVLTEELIKMIKLNHG